MKIKPLNDRVLVIRLDKENRSKGGIIIPDTAKEKPQKGRVVAVGPGKRGEDGKRFPPDLKEGDHVIFSKYAGTEININDVEHLFLSESDILALVN
ncbi:MAG: co-chaperone GroES [Desulfobacterales bacterium]|jgi:chaperonin GroES